MDGRYDLEKGLPFTDEEEGKIKKAGHNPLKPKPAMPSPAEDDGFDTPIIKDPFSHPT